MSSRIMRVSDLLPTPRSENWLFGDKSSAVDYVDAVRDGFRQQGRATEAAEQISLF